jgi:hypothetical protein
VKPPCSERVYTRLVGFLEGVLGERQTPGRKIEVTPASGKKRTADGSFKKSATEREAEVTPTKSKSTPKRTGDTFLGKIKASASKSNTANGDDNVADGQAPSCTSKMIRKLCNDFYTKDAIPHVYTGICVVLKLASLWPPSDTSTPGNESLQAEVTPLTIAIFLMILTRMQTAQTLNAKDYVKVVLRAVEVLEYDGGRKGVEQWVRRINKEKWGRDQEWFQNVPEGVIDFNVTKLEEHGLVGDEDDVDHVDLDHEAHSINGEEEENEILTSRRQKSSKVDQEEDDPEDVLVPGLATMMQESFDFLSAERVREYEKWKKAFLLKLEKLDGALAATPTKGRTPAKVARVGRSVAVK